jgi:hypothetical protein
VVSSLDLLCKGIWLRIVGSFSRKSFLFLRRAIWVLRSAVTDGFVDVCPPTSKRRHFVDDYRVGLQWRSGTVLAGDAGMDDAFELSAFFGLWKTMLPGHGGQAGGPG